MPPRLCRVRRRVQRNVGQQGRSTRACTLPGLKLQAFTRDDLIRHDAEGGVVPQELHILIVVAVGDGHGFFWGARS